jgi:hypothetical protein
LTCTEVPRLARLIALGGAAALGGIAAIALTSFQAGPADGASAFRDANDVSATSIAVATSVSFTMDLDVTIRGKATEHLLVQGEMNFAHHTIEADVTVPGNALLGAASAADADAAPTQSPVKLHTEWVDDRAYITVPSSWSAVAMGAQTLSIPTTASQRRTVDTALSQSAVALSYAKILLHELTDQQAVHRLGSRTIDGTPATGAKVDLTLAQLLKVVPELSPAMSHDARSMAGQPIAATVWVDRQGRLVAVTMAARRGQDAALTGSVRFSHYNAADTVAKPPAATTKPIPAALRRLLAGLYSSF